MAKDNGTWKIIGGVTSIVVLVLAIVVAAVRVESKVNHQAEDIAEMKKEADAEHMALEIADGQLDNQCDKLNDGMARLETEMKYLREDTKSILLYIKELSK